ncbi:MarR family transcriptional regulator [Micromonospora sp. ZYX-F-536]|uniref:MarR family transcriptional regulator n=1 Tax=Micromonospora sp. ZYX-F-536 TaxID=3457629 RepID=UPI0040409D39
MTDTSQEPVPAHSMIKVLAALAELGEATATAVAEHAGLGYSTTTPKLRAWEGSGQVERLRTDDGRALWRLTAAGRAATATTGESGGQRPADPGEPHPSVELETLDERSGNGDCPPAAAPDDQQAGDGDHNEPAVEVEPVASPTDDAATPTSADIDSAGKPSADLTRDLEPNGGEIVETPQAEARPANARRVGGSLRGAVLDVLEAHPDRQYKVGELCRLVDAANAGTGAAKASAGAAANALAKLVIAGKVIQTVERPATFQLAPTSGQ